jgi:rod shape-determining protein MreD
MSPKRVALFVGLGLFVLAAEGALRAGLLPLGRLPAPELMLLFVLYLGLSRPGSLVPHVLFGLGFGYLVDLFACAPRGVNALSLALFSLIARAAENRLMVTSAWQVAFISFFATFGHVLFVGLLVSLYGEESISSLRLVLSIAAMTALFSPVVFAGLRLVDRRLVPDPRFVRALR